MFAHSASVNAFWNESKGCSSHLGLGRLWKTRIDNAPTKANECNRDIFNSYGMFHQLAKWANPKFVVISVVDYKVPSAKIGSSIPHA